MPFLSAVLLVEIHLTYARAETSHKQNLLCRFKFNTEHWMLYMGFINLVRVCFFAGLIIVDNRFRRVHVGL